MGEYAEMMLEGIVCQFCGELIGDGEGLGFPTVCGGCQRAEGVDECGQPRGKRRVGADPTPSRRTIKCTVRGCTKGFATSEARDQHLRDRHKITTPEG
jgi:hypothetical protein